MIPKEKRSTNGTHVIPVIIGGDHSLMYSDVAGLADGATGDVNAR